MNRQFRWAIVTLLEFNNVPASPSNINAFLDPGPNQQWINAIIRGGRQMAGSMTSGVYDKVMTILQENGIDINIYGPGNGTGNN